MRVRKYIPGRIFKRHLIHQAGNISAAISLALAMVLLQSADARGCASCGCTLSSDWENLQFSTAPGLKIDLRYDFINQDELWSGKKQISPTAASQVNGGTNEVEQYTINNYVTLGIVYSINHDWGVNVQVPYIDRKHSTLGVGSDGYTPVPGGMSYDSHTKSIGDVKVIGRYQGFTPQCNFGVLYGVKLPTGSFNMTGTSTDPVTPGGPVPIDRGLQPGTGTTDAIVGAYYSNAISQDWDYFGSALFQIALDYREQYRPGDGVNLNAGLRYGGFSGFSPLLQFNFREVAHDQGGNADKLNTGGTLLYISPGITAAVGQHVSAYAFVQVPVYQEVEGVQLVAKFTYSVGVRYSF